MDNLYTAFLTQSFLTINYHSRINYLLKGWNQILVAPNKQP